MEVRGVQLARVSVVGEDMMADVEGFGDNVLI